MDDNAIPLNPAPLNELTTELLQRVVADSTDSFDDLIESLTTIDLTKLVAYWGATAIGACKAMDPVIQGLEMDADDVSYFRSLAYECSQQKPVIAAAVFNLYRLVSTGEMVHLENIIRNYRNINWNVGIEVLRVMCISLGAVCRVMTLESKFILQAAYLRLAMYYARQRIQKFDWQDIADLAEAHHIMSMLDNRTVMAPMDDSKGS